MTALVPPGAEGLGDVADAKAGTVSWGSTLLPFLSPSCVAGVPSVPLGPARDQARGEEGVGCAADPWRQPAWAEGPVETRSAAFLSLPPASQAYLQKQRCWTLSCHEVSCEEWAPTCSACSLPSESVGAHSVRIPARKSHAGGPRDESDGGSSLEGAADSFQS